MLGKIRLPHSFSWLIYFVIVSVAIFFYYIQYQEVLGMRKQLFKMQEIIVEITDKSNQYNSNYRDSVEKLYECEDSHSKMKEIYKKNLNIYKAKIERLKTSEKQSRDEPEMDMSFVNIENHPENLVPKDNHCDQNENNANSWPIPKQRVTPIPLNLEFFPNLLGPYVPPRFNKSLVVCTTGESGKEIVNSLVQKFGLKNFSYVFFLYDKSNWDEFEWFNKVVWIRANRQVKFWYIQRFITPALVKQYQFLWIIDDDVGVENIDPFKYEEVMRSFNLQWSQPANKEGPGFKISHPITKQVIGDHIGRYSKFVEVGPLMVFSSSAWNCAYSLLQADISCGWGYDALWYDYCKFKNAAIIDRYPLTHRFKGNLMAVPGRPDPLIERNALIKRFDYIEGNFAQKIAPNSLRKFG